MSDQLNVLKIVAGRLADAGIPYMVSGSMAMNYYAAPRMTRDIDVVVELGPEDVTRFLALFEPDFYLDEEVVRSATTQRGFFNLIHRWGRS